MANSKQDHSGLQRKLVDPISGKIWRASLSDATVELEAGNPKKPRKREKALASSDKAKEFLLKEQWKKLKSGYVLSNPDAVPGEPVLHLFLSSGYTGMLALASSGSEVFCCRYSEPDDHFFKIDANGEAGPSWRVPGQKLALELEYADSVSRLLLNADHGICVWDPDQPDDFQTLSTIKGCPASCLSVGGTSVAVFENPKVIVKDIIGGKSLFSVECPPELYRGHTHQLAAALSQKGDTLAVCSKSGTVALFDVAGKKTLAEMKGNFEMVERLQFDRSGDLLVAQAHYDPWGLLFFDVKKKKMIVPPLKLPEIHNGEESFALDPNQSRMAVASSKAIHIFDTDSLLQTQVVPLENFLKRINMRFCGDRIAVRTDKGCLSLYALNPVAG